MKLLKIFEHGFRFIKYLLRTRSKSSIKSEFVRDLYTKVISANKEFYAIEEIRGVRAMLGKNNSVIQVTDFGAGSHINQSKERLISDIAKNSAKSEKTGKVLTALCDHFQPKNCLEMGTSLGISTLYQYSGCKSARWVTMEGCPQTAAYAKKVFSAFKASNIEIVVGDFAKTLQPTVDSFNQLDYVFFDGNHQKQATIDYFEVCLAKATNQSLFVFDDIHWSAGMEEAWDYIKRHPKVTVTIDLFQIGLVFFDQNHQKEDFTLLP